MGTHAKTQLQMMKTGLESLQRSLLGPERLHVGAEAI
jgi:hypothetical protein